MTRGLGYSGRILRVDLSSSSTVEVPTADYADRFLGGRGIAAKIYWDEVSPTVKALDPENRLIVMTGPLGGFPGLAGSRWTVCGKSPTTTPGFFSYASLGGSWGAHLKFAGYDGIVIQGKSDRPAYLMVDDGTAEIRDASFLWGKSSTEAREILKDELGESVRVVACGPAGENMVSFANLIADDDSSGSSGFGAVMGSKGLKAIAVRGSGKVAAANPEKLRDLTRYILELKKVSIEGPMEPESPQLKKTACYGCIRGCIRRVYEAKDGRKGKSMCGAAEFYRLFATEYYGESDVNEVCFSVNRLCDEYGLDTNIIESITIWLSKCHQGGILTEESAGLPISRIGSLEFMESLVKKISQRDGFGDILAHGIIQAADIVGGRAKEEVSDINPSTGQRLFYGPRMYITNALIHALALSPKQPIGHQVHEVMNPVSSWVRWAKGRENAFVTSDVIRAIALRFWGSELAADCSTYEGKPLAAKMIQDRAFARECLIVCDMVWQYPSVEFAENHVGDPTIESQVLSAVIGKEVDEESYYRIGERVFNLQRAILVRDGYKGRAEDTIPEHYFVTPLERTEWNSRCLAPGKDGEMISRKGSVVDRKQFEMMKDEYYSLRGWDVATGLQTKAKLNELDLGDVAKELEAGGLVL